jgi:hypothetical protein
MARLALLLLLTNVALAADTHTGWVSDKACASGRANGGVYTGTNPDCAKRCIGEGTAMVLVDDKAKALYEIANPELLKPQIGNYVEVRGVLDKQSNTLKVEKVKLLQVGTAQCGRKRLK